MKLVELYFSSFLPSEAPSLEELFLKRNDENCKNSVAVIVNFHESMVNAIYDTAKEVSHIKTILDLYYRKEYSSITELDNINKQLQYSSGRLWVLSGMCLLEVFLGVGPVDPLQKIKVRNECLENEVRNIFCL